MSAHADPALEPWFDAMRRSVEPVDASILYAGWLIDARIEPAAHCLTVSVTRGRVTLDLSSRRTLAATLSSIEEEPAARAPSRRDRPTLVSRQALP